MSHWSLVIGHWSLVIGHWSLVTCTALRLRSGTAKSKYWLLVKSNTQGYFILI
ncbi:hypothetical protein LC605_18990 [Nostoc sp. CHAB 5836]|uniref:hypothetical protein n=1 Tax=Nostoc sp. CHAB 5836 TaxID=2780404 RepID=UPI001E2EA94E|nr:hypothetical protein [Nostoc sp. CHAB 5836]MCC5617127.1 hypothetical protein [Nostoc sp. CHAB 5836]